MAYNAQVADSPHPWPIEGIRMALAYLPVFRRNDFVVATWDPPLKRVVDGLEINHLPYPEYSLEVEQFWAIFASTGGFINPYESLPEDAEDWKVRIYDAQNPIDLGYLGDATIDQIRRWLSLTKRGERFCDGHIESQFDNGFIVAALLRLQTLIGDDRVG